jgi:hypothetical protein
MKTLSIIFSTTYRTPNCFFFSALVHNVYWHLVLTIRVISADPTYLQILLTCNDKFKTVALWNKNFFNLLQLYPSLVQIFFSLFLSQLIHKMFKSQIWKLRMYWMYDNLSIYWSVYMNKQTYRKFLILNRTNVYKVLKECVVFYTSSSLKVNWLIEGSCTKFKAIEWELYFVKPL